MLPVHALDDLRQWGDRVTPGAQMLVHDSWCSVGVTLATLVGVTAGGGWRYEAARVPRVLPRTEATASSRARQLGATVVRRQRRPEALDRRPPKRRCNF